MHWRVRKALQRSIQTSVRKTEKSLKTRVSLRPCEAVRAARFPQILGPGGLGTGIGTTPWAAFEVKLWVMLAVPVVSGLRGSGGGGGGNSLGIGSVGSGTGRGTGGLGNVDLGGRGKGKYKVSVGRIDCEGCLQESVVRRVLQRAQSQARYCYEKELQRNPNLSGKVTTQITIGSTGSVYVLVSQNRPSVMRVLSLATAGSWTSSLPTLRGRRYG